MKVGFSFSFSEIMDCATVSSSLKVDAGRLVVSSLKCENDVSKKIEPNIQSTQWTIEGTIDKVPDGVIYLTVGQGAKTADGRAITVNTVISFH
jgi:hypothetical protein